MPNDPAPATVDLTNCDREPIQIPGRILPHGVLLVVDPERLVIEQLAGDTTRLLGRPADELLGQPLAEVVTEEQRARIAALVQASSLQRPRHLLDPVLRIVADHPTDASIHLADGALLIEFEDADLDDRHVVDPLACVQDMFDGLGDAPELQDYCQWAAERVRTVIGYDRVMVYRFMPDDSGWVFAEARHADLTPFLDLHYPASDIPKQARALYLTSTLRLITEVDYEPAPVVPLLNPRSGRPLDLSQAVLRDVSPIHREYLRNMGVNASMSISIVHEGKLWGLIACHHRTPRRLPRHLRAVCELFGSIFSLQLEARLRAASLAKRLESRAALNTILHALAIEDDYAVGLVAQREALLGYVAAGGLALRLSQSEGGIAIRVNDGISVMGTTPTDDQIAALTDWLTTTMKPFEGVFSTDRLSDLFPPAAAYAGLGSGLLAISVSREPHDFILWFRPEVLETVRWGGDPNKPVEQGPNGARLTPRKSFEVWTETVRRQSAPWSSSDQDAAFDLRVSLLEIVLRRIDAAARERLRAWEHEQLLMAELDHRVKNTLANIQALVTQTSRSANSLGDFTAGLDSRIRSMSRTHSLLTKSRWEGVSIESLLQEELDAYRMQHGEITLSGPNVSLTPKAALALSLATHELATNAAKYGALSIATGRLEVLWQMAPDGALHLVWRESEGPVVTEPKRRGFGSTLIERALAMETGGTSALSFPATGVICTIVVPATALHLTPGPAAAPIPPASIEAGGDPGAEVRPAQRILVVEDSALVLMEIEDAIGDVGWQMVGPAMRLDEALALVRTEQIDAALFDVNLDGEMSWEAAAIAQDRGIPFVFTTGYDSNSMIPARFAEQKIVPKPFKRGDIVRALRAMLP